MSLLSTIRPILLPCLVESSSLSIGKSKVRGASLEPLKSHQWSQSAKPLPLPRNVEDIIFSERARFSPRRSRDINGSLLAGASSVKCSDARVSSYDCSGTVTLRGHMQSNVPSPCTVEGPYTHFNMPGGLWALNEKYTAADHLVYSTLYRHFSTDNSGKQDSGQKGLTRKEQLKAAVKDYGSVVIVFHVGISLISLGACYVAVTSGIDVRSLMQWWGTSEGAETAAVAAPFVVAYAVHKAFAPIRISVTLVSVPFIVKYLRRVGWMKKPKPRDN